MMITQFTPMRKPNIMSEWGEKYSLYVYICHPFIGFVIGLIREDMPSLWGVCIIGSSYDNILYLYYNFNDHIKYTKLFKHTQSVMMA